ncbi:MAG: hypothetical protein GY903_14380 [Fuerstiella sp.]|nr:hypothetical protein [Fuerstiella sp.]MCP4855672.1 hypothetical protein [Fuerstiella sp.]
MAAGFSLGNLARGDIGPTIVPGKPEESELIRAIRRGLNGYQMSARQ